MADGQLRGRRRERARWAANPVLPKYAGEGEDLIRKSAISPQVVEVAEPVSACRGLVIDRVTLGSVVPSRVCTLRQ